MVRIVRMGTTARRVAAALPVLALATAGIAFARPDAPAPTSVTVPDQAITQGASPAYPQAGPTPAPMQLPPVYETYTDDWARVDVPALARGVLHALDPLAPVRLDANGIPSVALAAYHRAAALIGRIDPGCGLDWALLGAIGRVESNHARFGGNVLDSAGVARPGIVGIALDGSRGTTRITDTDDGTLDRDTVYDRAVGPMQFIPTTWALSGRDGDGDGVANPQSLTDAVTAAGALLCSGRADLRERSAAYDAVRRYNHSDTYVRTVLAIADAYRRGGAVVPMGALPAARPATGSGTATPEGSGFGYAGSSAPRPTASSSARPTPDASAKPSSPDAKTTPSSSPDGSSSRPPLPSSQPGEGSRPGGIGVPSPSLPRVPLPTATVPSATVPTEITRLLSLPHLPLLPGDPEGLVRVIDPVSGTLVCVLDQNVVACPTAGVLD